MFRVQCLEFRVKDMKKFYLILALCGAWVAGMACTNFLVGKDASVDGSTMVSYAADSYALYGFLHHSPAADYEIGRAHV